MLCQRGERDGRAGDPESRHARRQHRQRLARGATRRPRFSSTMRSSNSSRPRARAGFLTGLSHRLQTDDDAPGRVDQEHPAAAAAGPGGTTTARSGRARPRRSRKSASRALAQHRTERSIADIRIALGKRRARSSSGARRLKTSLRIASGRRSGERPRAPQLAREISPIDDIRSTANYRFACASNVLEDFLRTRGQNF